MIKLSYIGVEDLE